MKKKTILSIAVACLAALTASCFLGCQAVSDFKEEHPVAYDIISQSSKAMLQMQVPKITDDLAYQSLLRDTINAAFLVANTPDGIGRELEAGVAEVFPADPELQAMVISEFVHALTTEPDPSVPASSAGGSAARDFRLELAAALRPGVSYYYEYDFDPAYTVKLASAGL